MHMLTPRQKQQRRTDAAVHAAYQNHNLDLLVQMIADMSESLKLNTGQPTLAIGKYLAEIWICSNGAGGVDKITVAATEATPEELKACLIQATNKKGGNFENMHAEMVIVNNIAAPTT